MLEKLDFKPQLIVSDIDGTLLDESEKIPQTQVAELAQLIKEKNLNFTLASGREKTQVEELRKLLDIDLPILTCNGAAAYSGDAYLWADSIPVDLLQPLVKEADSLDMTVVFSLPEYECAYRRTDFVQETIKTYGRFHIPFPALTEDWSDISVQKVLLIDPHESGRLADLLANLEGVLSIVNYNNRSADLTPANTSKAHGVARLAKHLGVDLDSVLVFGDSFNDVEMLQEAGFGVAVQNAVPTLKEIADYVSGKPYIDGVLEVLREL